MKTNRIKVNINNKRERKLSNSLTMGRKEKNPSQGGGGEGGEGGGGV